MQIKTQLPNPFKINDFDYERINKTVGLSSDKYVPEQIKVELDSDIKLIQMALKHLGVKCEINKELVAQHKLDQSVFTIKIESKSFDIKWFSNDCLWICDGSIKYYVRKDAHH